MTITQIGKCMGCQKMGALDDGVGKCCLDHPQRGRQWALAAHRVRVDPSFAKKVWESLEGETAKLRFISIFGKMDFIESQLKTV